MIAKDSTAELMEGRAGEAADTAETLLATGNAEAALSVIADGLATYTPGTRLLTLGASAWVALVDQGASLDGWEPGKRERLLRCLVTQDGSDVSFSILHHRIAAQHSGGIAGHLSRQARALGPTLIDLLREEPSHPKTLLLALLLRSVVDGIDQSRLSTLHQLMFASFSADDLQIPYSFVFDRKHFKRNVDDLREYVEARGDALADGSLPLSHLLLLYWLVPQSFAALSSDWPSRALHNRPVPLDGVDDISVDRSLRLRFGIPPFSNEIENLTPCAERLADVRRTLLVESGSGDDAAVSRLEQRSRQVAASVLNEVRGRFPFVRSRRRLRVAICVSGQLRGFRRAWATWRPLLSNADTTIFVDSWTRIGCGTPEPFRSNLPFEGAEFCATYKQVGAETGLDELRMRYPHLFTALEQGGVVDERDLADLYKTPHIRLDDDTDAAFAMFTNSEKMYYKVQRCFEMAQADGDDFDLVVRLRPDKPITLVAFDWFDLLAALRARPALYCETALGVHYGAILMGDQVAIGLPEAMRVYAETFSRSPHLAALAPYRMEPNLCGHTSVAQLCWFSDMEVRKVPIKFGPFLEAEPLAAAAIQDALGRDSANRMDAVDRHFLSAIQRDLRR